MISTISRRAEAAAQGAGNTPNGLTPSLDLGKEGLMPNPTRACSVEGCETRVEARGWCKKHYRRWQTHGDATYEAEPSPEVCVIDGCNKPYLARGWCSAHWTRWQRHGDPLAGGPDRTPMPDQCVIDDCGFEPFARGLCATHWRRTRRSEDPAWHEHEHEHEKERRRAWTAANPERVAAARKRSRELHLAINLARCAQWRAENTPAVFAANWRSRRRAHGLSESTIEIVDPSVVYERDAGVCSICAEQVDPQLSADDPRSATIDHVVPVVDPASEHSYANCALAHRICNQIKGARAIAMEGIQ